MHRSRTQRGFALFLAIWLVACVTAAAAVHRCPEHDAPAGMLAQSGGHAMHHGMPAPHGGHGHHQCTCLGECAATACVAVVPAREYGPVAVVLRMDAPTPVADAPRVTAPPHTLPFANGPPHALGA